MDEHNLNVLHSPNQFRSEITNKNIVIKFNLKLKLETTWPKPK